MSTSTTPSSEYLSVTFTNSPPNSSNSAPSPTATYPSNDPLALSSVEPQAIFALALLIITFCFLIYTKSYTLSDLLADLRAIIYGDTLNYSNGASTTKVDEQRSRQEARQRARSAFSQYGSIAFAEVQEKRRRFSKMTKEHQRIATEAGYSAKLDLLHETVKTNAVLANAIASTSFHDEEKDRNHPYGAPGFVRSRSGMSSNIGTDDMNRVREAMKHFVRDWSDEGTEERVEVFGRVLEAVKKWIVPMSICENGDELDVLVPGCGLGRLAWEVHQLGLQTTALELSPYMSLAFHFLSSPRSTQQPNQHTLHPYAYWFSHQRTNNSLFRSVRFPDVVPRTSETFKYVEGDFLTHTHISSESTTMSGGYACIITLFFIDTSSYVLSTLQQIYSLLRPGGVWINLGPLLWPVEACLEPCLEEVWAMCKGVGFEVLEGAELDGEKSGDNRVRCEYTKDKGAMMRWVYEAEIWVMRKPVRGN